MAFNIKDIIDNFDMSNFTGDVSDEKFSKIADDLSREFETAKSKLGHVNIIVAGGTGVGKSTLINAVFGEELVKTGIGKPVTSEIIKIEKQNTPVTIYDTMGFELGGNNTIDNVKNDLTDLVNRSRESSNCEEWIHIMWYCISLGKSRIQDAEIDYINYLCTLGVPVILVITQAISKNRAEELKTVILNCNINNIKEIIPVLAQDYEFDTDNGTQVLSAYNVEKLVEVSFEYLPEAAQKAFAAHQIASIVLKQKLARKYVKVFAATNFGSAFIPIPMSDAPVLIAGEVTMIAKISVIFGLAVDKKMWISILSAVIGCSGATALGKSVVSGLLKLIPGIGTVAGGAISASTAAALTYALGEAYIQILTLIEKGEIDKNDIFSKDTKSKMKEIVKTELAHKRNEEGDIVID